MTPCWTIGLSVEGYTSGRKLSLDMTTFVHKGVQYCAWAQKGREYDGASVIYLSRMKDSAYFGWRADTAHSSGI